VILRIGKVSPELAEIHRSHRVDCSAFITAFNPFSQPFDEQENERRHELLLKEIKLRSLPIVQGLGSHPDNGWPPEVSLLVPGLSLEASKSLGTRFEQNAIVWSATDTVPQLILLRRRSTARELNQWPGQPADEAKDRGDLNPLAAPATLAKPLKRRMDMNVLVRFVFAFLQTLAALDSHREAS
jgi:hypothetical protein